MYDRKASSSEGNGNDEAKLSWDCGKVSNQKASLTLLLLLKQSRSIPGWFEGDLCLLWLEEDVAGLTTCDCHG